MTMGCYQLQRYSCYSTSTSTSRQHHKQPHQKKQLHRPTPTKAKPTTTEQVNPPSSTRPSPLSMPDALPATASTSDKFKRYMAVGKAYINFYKTGIKNVYHNYRASIPLRQNLGLPVYLPTSVGNSIEITNNKVNNAITRSEFQLIERSAHDIRRLIPFCFLLLVCGEMTPLVVLALGNAITPATCRVPAQVRKHDALRAARKNAALVVYQTHTAGAVKAPQVGSEEELDVLMDFADTRWVESASTRDVLCACAVLDLADSHAGGREAVGFAYRQRLRQFAAYLGLDDALIVSGGGVGALNRDEVRLAVVERGGGDVAGDGKGEKEERQWLERWIQRKQQQGETKHQS